MTATDRATLEAARVLLRDWHRDNSVRDGYLGVWKDGRACSYADMAATSLQSFLFYTRPDDA